MPALKYGKTGGKGLSYSRSQLLHLCPRKFQLIEIFGLVSKEENVDFDYGHMVGAGVQHLVAHPGDVARAVLVGLSAWDGNLFAESEKPQAKKNVWYAIRAIQKFAEYQKEKTFFRDYEIAFFRDHNGKMKPAIEVTFQIRCYEGYTYEGHIDLILRNKKNGQYLILELKTSSFSNLDEAMYKNSAQTLGYSVILDSIAKSDPDLNATSSYHVMYLIYKSGKMEYEDMPFPKSKLQRAHFINFLVLDIEQAEMFREYNIYPMRGEACYNFFRQCEFFEKCTYSDEALKAMAASQQAQDERYGKLTDNEFDFVFDLEEIKAHQLEEVESGKKELIAVGG
jgi:hypothetical protein